MKSHSRDILTNDLSKVESEVKAHKSRDFAEFRVTETVLSQPFQQY